MKIFTGQDRAQELGFDTYRNFMIKLAISNGSPWKGEFTNSNPLYAYVDWGRWSVLCECGSPYYAEPTDDTFGYCPVCGNAVLDGAARRMIFPANRDEIEEELLERELDSKIHPSKITTQSMLMLGLVKPKYIDRSWRPGESVKDLQKEHKKVKMAMKKLEVKHGA